MKQQWENLSPKHRRWAVIGLALAVVSVVVMFGSPEQKKIELRERKNKDETRHVLTDTNTREVGMDSLAANVGKVLKDNAVLQEKVAAMSIQLEKKNIDEDAALIKARLNEISRQLDDSRKEREEMRTKLDAAKKAAREMVVDANYQLEQKLATGEAGVEGTADPAATPDGSTAPKRSRQEVSPEDVFTSSSATSATEAFDYQTDDTRAGEPAISSIQIRSFAEQESAQEKQSKIKEEEEKESVYLPAGSILTGVLITGMDAPTGEEARKDPHPVLVRIQKEAILPNRFTADIRECFMTMSGWGQLSSERAYVRGETISCVRDDGGIIESKIQAYGVGEDGKAGIRGKVVSKQGLILARAMQAGFAQGVAGAFGKQAVPVVQTTDVTSNPLFQDALSSDTLQSGAVNGFSGALERLAQFYIEMAEDIFPIIEISAGRSVQLIITSGISLRVKR